MQPGALLRCGVALGLLAAVACDPTPTTSDPTSAGLHAAASADPAGADLRGGSHVPLAPPTAAEVAATSAHLLPAWLTQAERTSGKLDASDDYRAAHPEWFGQTVPPKAGRFRPYGEWEPMQSVWTTYSNGMPNSKAVRRMMAEQTIQFVRHSKPQVKAYAIVNNATVAADFHKALSEYGITPAEKAFVQTVTLPNQTIWLMDYSGFPLVDKVTGQVAFADWIYYQPRHLDDALGTRVGTQFYPGTAYRVPFPFEGGNIQADGHGQCATTTRALKNTGYSAAKVRNILKRWSACDTTYILKDITDDGTGHLDMFFKWLAPDHVLISRYEDSLTLDYNGDGTQETLVMPGKVAKDYSQTWALNRQRMEDNVALFKAATTYKGGSFKVSRLTMMTRFKDTYGDLPRTFINSTFTNGVNVYPSYTTLSCRNNFGASCMTDNACPQGQHCAAGKCTQGPTAQGCDALVACPSGLSCVSDPFKVALTARAQQQWQDAMPAMKHVGLRADSIAMWSGAIHCITRTLPKGPITKTVADALCVQGTCGCEPGGAVHACTGHSQCTGPARMCDCQVCKGTCKGSGKSCTDDTDCGVPAALGACVVDPKVACGATGGGSDPCGGVTFEGQCQGKQLSYCDGSLKKQSCQGCCGWDAQSGYYNCLSGAACNGCVDECGAVGQTGCSSKGTHAWTCSKVGGCLVRSWTPCAGGCSQGQCGGGSSGGGGTGGMVSQCPTGGGTTDAGTPDAGGADTGAADVGAPDVGAPDAGTPDTGSPDAGSPDAGAPDAGAQDAGTPDAGAPDTTHTDGIQPAADTAKSDASAADAPDGSAQRGADASRRTPDSRAADTSAGGGSRADGVAAPDAATPVALYRVAGGSRSGCSATGGAPGAPAPWLALLAASAWIAWRRRTSTGVRRS